MSSVKYGSIWDSRLRSRALRHISSADQTMAGVISRVGKLELDMPTGSYYESIVESFIYQQIAGSAADAILRKFKGLYGGRIPSPKQFLLTPLRRARSAGLSPQKYSYIRDLCERLERSELDLEGLEALPDEEVIAVLDEVRGIGRWTAEMFLMFRLGRPDVMPADDLGIQNAIRAAYGLARRPSKGRIIRLSEGWSPYRSVAALYLWRSLDMGK